MTRKLLLSSWIALAAMLPHAHSQQAQTTTWKGSLDAQGIELRLEIDITESAGKFNGELRSLDQNKARLKLASIELSNEKLAFVVPQVGAKFEGQLENKGVVAKGTFTQNGVEMPLTLTKSAMLATDPKQRPEGEFREAWVGKLNMGIVEPVMQFRIMELPSGETTARFDSITEGRTDFDATWSIEGDTIQFDVADIKLRYVGRLIDAGNAAEGTWSQGGRDVPLALKKQSAPWNNENVWENRPQRPVGPFPYDAIDVTFTNTIDEVTLAGTLTLPKHQGRHPAVVLISGSGPQDRDESLMEHKPFLVLADYLSRRGVAVLRYDDRGFGKSTGDFGDATTEDFARDASAAVAFLKQHDRIKDEEIGLAGHSEGGIIAPMVAGLRDDIAFIVLMAATGVDGGQVISSQSEALMRAMGTDEAERRIGQAINLATMEILRNATGEDDLSAKLDAAIERIILTVPESDREQAATNIRAAMNMQKDQVQSKWMRFFVKYDPRPALSKLKCPVLAIVGSRDLQVLPSLNLPEIRQALERGGNQDFEIVELEGLNHLLQLADTGSVGEYATIQETLNPLALKTIGDWILDRMTIVK